jgi:hypothetical protein
VLPYAAYLRVYEPLTAFPEPERSMWAAYATSTGRPDQGHAADSEHAEALRRLVAAPRESVPARESQQAYVRWADGGAYVCPWQTRLRSWLALERFLGTLPKGLAASFVPPAVAERAGEEFQRWKEQRGTLRVHILCSTWRVPLPWFLSFDPTERWLVLGTDAEVGGDRLTAARALGYLTTMAQAGQRLGRAMTAVCHDVGGNLPCGGVEDLRRWLAEFHPRSLVELDYGGLVHLLDDDALRSDQSVAEAAAAVTGLETGQAELTAAMYERVTDRWRLIEALESAN